ncbi:MAG: amidohydrolase [Bacteroidia bacterium]|nr:amidohydrolase [Bacteroidia bacterium]
MDNLNITLIQSNLYWEAPKKNREMFQEKILSVEKPGDIILLPEMFNTGFSMNPEKLAETMNGETMEWMTRMSGKTNAVITGSLIISEENKYYNRLIWMHPNGSYSHYDKRHLFSLAGEDKVFAAGQHQWIMPIKGWNVFPLICYDLRFPVWSRRNPQLDYDLIIYVANWPDVRIRAWNHLLIARAIENQSYVAGVNRVGNDGNEFSHSGNSCVIDYKGEILSSFEINKEQHETITLNKDELADFRKQLPFSSDADRFEIS